MSDDVIIRAENISKRYVLNHQSSGGYRKFSDTLIHAAKAPLRWLKTVNSERRTENLSEDFWALKDINFEVKQGEVVGIIGRNGAGKSTLLKILSRITEPTTGRITLRGRVASLLEVGTGFHPELTGRENIFLNGAILGMRREEIKAKFDEIVAFAEIEKFLDTPVKRYSSGMYVRLAFAVAAHLEPEILIVDEVLAVGDAQFQKKCLGKMKDVAGQDGRTVFFVSHNLKALEHFCTRGLLMESGKLAMDDDARVCVAEYLRRGAGDANGLLPKALGEELQLVGLSITPRTVRPREPVEFVVELLAQMDCEIHDMCLFLYNSFGERAAIIDLRDLSSREGSRSLGGGQRIKYCGLIKRVVFVDGIYRLGFTLRTGRYAVTHYDLAELQVESARTSTGPMPYALEYQGTTLLDYDFSAEVV